MLLPAAAAILVGGTLALIGAFGDDDQSGEGDEVSQRAEAEIAAARGRLTETLDDQGQGISTRFPTTWRASRLGGERLLESHNRCMAIKLSAPAKTGQVGRVRRDTLTALRRGFKRIRVVPGEEGNRIGGIPTTQDVVTVATKRGEPVRILVSVGKGEELAYLTEFVLRDSSCARTLLEAQLVLNSIRYSR